MQHVAQSAWWCRRPCGRNDIVPWARENTHSLSCVYTRHSLTSEMSLAWRLTGDQFLSAGRESDQLVTFRKGNGS